MKTYGLIGYPLGHSFSRQFFTEKFEKEGIDAEYINFEIEQAEQLLDVVRDHPTLRGLNCTIPHKQAIIPLLDELSDEARKIGAVNVIRITRTSSSAALSQEKETSLRKENAQEKKTNEKGFHLKGYNSDVIGFTESIRPLLHSHHRKALVLGTGGASKAICAGLENLGLEWKYVSRSPRDGHFTYNDITPAVINEYEVIVNCSPVGMHPHNDEAPEIPYNALCERHLLYDLVYNPLQTEFMKRGAAKGATVKNGLEMLHLQALASWEFWNKE